MRENDADDVVTACYDFIRDVVFREQTLAVVLDGLSVGHPELELDILFDARKIAVEISAVNRIFILKLHTNASAGVTLQFKNHHFN